MAPSTKAIDLQKILADLAAVATKLPALAAAIADIVAIFAKQPTPQPAELRKKLKAAGCPDSLCDEVCKELERAQSDAVDLLCALCCAHTKMHEAC